MIRPLLLAASTLLAAGLPAQGRELLAEPLAPQAVREIALPGEEGPALLFVLARASEDGGGGGLRLRVGDGPVRPLAGAAPHTWLEVPRGARRMLRVEAVDGGLALASVVHHRAVEVDLEVVEDGQRRPVASRVRIEAVDGFEAPRFGCRPAEGWWEHTRLCPAGRGRLLLPADRPVTLSAAATPFHRPVTRQVRTVATGRQTVRLVLGRATPPPGATPVAPPALESWGLGSAVGDVDRVLGIRLRDPVAEVTDGAAAARRPAEFVRRLLDGTRRPPILRLGGPAGPFPRELRPLTTHRLRSGAYLHTNGPRLRVSPILRRRDPRRDSVAFGEVEVAFDHEVEGGRLAIWSERRAVVDVPVREPQTVPLELALPPGTRLVALFRAARFEDADVLHPPPLAFHSFVLP